MPGPVSPRISCVSRSCVDVLHLGGGVGDADVVLAGRAAEPRHLGRIEPRARRIAQRPERGIAGDDREHRAVLWRGAVDVARRDVAAGARHVLRHHRRIAGQVLADVAGDGAAPQVVAATRPEADDQRDILADERLGCGLRVSLRRTPNARREKRHPQPNRSPHHASPHCLAAALICSGCRISFCTRQFRISATNSVFSDGHAIS